MFISGAIVLFFLIVHVGQFAWEIWLPGPKGEEPFAKAIRILNDNFTAAVYLVGVGDFGNSLVARFCQCVSIVGNHASSLCGAN